MPFGVNPTGLNMPRAYDYLTLIRSEMETLLAARGIAAPDWERDTFLGPLTETMASRLDALSEAAIQIDAGYAPNNAEGLQLENICAYIGVIRREATKSQVTLSLTANAGTTIPEGSIVEDDQKQRWLTTAPLVFATTTTQTVVAEAEVAGAVEAPAATITKIITPVTGWTASTNVSAATTGEARETDAELRARRILSLQVGTSGTVAGIRGAVFALTDWVVAATVVDNPTNATAVVEGITMPAHSLAVVLYPNTPTADQITELIETLAGVVPAGIEQVGAESGTYTYDDGHTATFNWDYATQTAVNVTVTATALAGYSTAEVQAGIEAVITEYFLSLGVGDDVRAISVLALISTVEGVDTADATVGAGAQKVAIDATQIAIEGTISVTVT